MKSLKIIYWLTTLLVAIPMFGNGILEIIQPKTLIVEAEKLGYPLYFFTWLGVAKISGSILIIIPTLKENLKDLVYAGFFFDFVFAFISLIAIGEFPKSLAPIIFLILLFVSCRYSKKIKE